MLNIYINTWGNYNENGADLGEWITLPMDEDELQEKLDEAAERMNDDYPEWFVNDYEWTCDLDLFEVHENDNYFTLNDRLNELNDLSEYEQTVLAAIMEAITSDLDDALEYVQNGDYQFYPDMNLTDVAEELVQECYFTKDTPDIFTRYFDYEAFGRDLHFDGYYETQYGVIYVD